MARLLIITAALLTFQASFVMLNFDWMSFPAIIGTTIDIGSFYTNMLPLKLDQMMRASAEEFSDNGTGGAQHFIAT